MSGEHVDHRPALLPQALLPTEFIRLTVIIGKAQQIELSLLVDLKSGESDRQRAEIFCDQGDLPSGMIFAVKTSPSHGWSFRLAPVA